METSQPAIEMLDPRSLRPHSKNARRHPKLQISKIADSILEFGFQMPILVDREGTVIAGHARLAAALKLKLVKVPCLRAQNLSEIQVRAYRIADNQLATTSQWDELILGEELRFLSQENFDLSLTGFTIGEVDLLIESENIEEPGNPQDDNIPRHAPPRCAVGDIWKLGDHRLICADARLPQTIVALMNGKLAEMAIVDPPYNLPIGNVSGLGSVKHGDFAMACGELSSAQFIDFLKQSFERLCDATNDGAICFVFMDWRHLEEILAAGKSIFTELKNLIVWSKTNGGMGSFYRSRHELIFAYKNGTAPHINSFELGQHGRYRTNIWNYAGGNTFKKDRMEELATHPTVKPVQMLADAIKDVSNRGGIVVDTFAGSGSTLIAAHKTGRRAYICEIDPLYCDKILARWEAFAKDSAELVGCGFPRCG